MPFLLVGALERRCWGQTGPVLTVERKLGAEGCPDGDALSSRVERIRGRATDNVKIGYEVTFAHDEEAFSATIRSSPGGTGVRTLEDRGTTCAALAQATAVTLALLLDSDATPAEEPKPAPNVPRPAPPPPAPPPPKVPIAPVAPERSIVYATLAIGGAAMAGVIQPVAPALSGEAGLSVARWHAGLGLLVGLPQNIALGAGIVRETLLSSVARVCYAPFRSDPWTLDTCTGGYIGRVTAEGRGFSSNTQQGQWWIAFPFEVGGTYEPGPVGLQLAAAALVPLQRQNFKIDNLGIAYESTPVAVMISLRLIGQLKL